MCGIVYSKELLCKELENKGIHIVYIWAIRDVFIEVMASVMIEHAYHVRTHAGAIEEFPATMEL